ncbi:MAG TPA: TIGR02300 family protein [Alphaproteobacteria bacterium]|nr:TIGR02300 family protein [Alphaproteobacteria bacterium]
MVKVEWGAKRQCLGCGTRFYDMRKSPITCPKCGSVYEIAGLSKSRRRQSAVEKDAGLIPLDLDTPLDLEDDIEATIDDGDALIEDDTDLSDDLDEMGGVLDDESEV